MSDIMKQPMAKRFDYLYEVFKSPRFLTMQGLGNEVPFFICPFDPQEANEMAQLVKNLVDTLSRKGVRILTVNLYDLCINLLQKRGIWERILQQEPDLPKSEFKELLQGVLDPETHVVPAIAEQIQERPISPDILFITGVGEVFPYIRSHTILNNLQRVAKDHPTVLFFPGQYTQSAEKGASLDLFGRLHDDRYYRAFNIYHAQ
jgi:hypothetical protein